MKRSSEDNLLLLRLCSAAVHAARDAMLPRDDRLIPNFYVLYLHPSLQQRYHAWSQEKDLDFAGHVEEVLRDEYGDDNSSEWLTGQPYRVVIWSNTDSNALWRLHPDHFVGAADREIVGISTHLSNADWERRISPLLEQDGRRRPFPLDGSTELITTFDNETRSDYALIKQWAPYTLITPLHHDLHMLYAISLFETGGDTDIGRPPFNRDNGVLGYIETHPCHHLALRTLVRGFGNRQGSWKKRLQRAATMVEKACKDCSEVRPGGLFRGPLRYWRDTLALLNQLVDYLEQGNASLLITSLEKHERQHGFYDSANLRFSPLLFSYLWALSQTRNGQKRSRLLNQARWLCRIKFESKKLHGSVFSDQESLEIEWSDFAQLLQAPMSLTELADGLEVKYQNLISLLV